MTGTFVAIDFETANFYRNSACAVGLVRVEKGKIVRQAAHLIRPPESYFTNTGIHGITWSMVKNEPTFEKLWPVMQRFCEGAAFFAAHNAPFDRSVLHACCETYGIAEPGIPFECTVRRSRAKLNLQNHQLPTVCRHLGIRLNHHDPLSDALACAEIILSL